MELKTTLTFDEIENSINLAEKFGKQDLATIAESVVEGYQIDKESRAEWDSKTKLALEIAKQMVSSPTPEGRANVKYPLITTAAIQFASRAYPEFIRNGKVVNVGVIGIDPDGSKEQTARRISDHMSWQLLTESDEWEPAFDNLLHILPVIGTVFKKTYYNPIDKRNESKLCLPDEVFVKQDVESLTAAYRVTHFIHMRKNEIIEQMRYGYFCEDLDIFKTTSQSYPIGNINQNLINDDRDKDAPRPILEQHCFLDLDGDGYQEPYIVTVDFYTKTVLRIYKRFDPDQVDKLADKIRRIIPTQYFTAFRFIPAPDGTFMGLGYGQLLLPINMTVNDTINQLLDAGTFNNRPPIFYAREVRINKKGRVDVAPGASIFTDCPAADLSNGVHPLPISPPSQVLFNLLNQMIESGQQLSSVTDVLQGQIPTQNSPATTVLAMVEQGLKPFSAIQKRIWRSLKEEYEKLFRLNSKYLDVSTYATMEALPVQIAAQDYKSGSFSVAPVAEPSMSSDAQRIARAQSLLQLMPTLPPTGQLYALSLYMDALQFPQSQIQRLLPPPDPNLPPSPETVKTLADADLMHAKQQHVYIDAQLRQQELSIQQQLADVQSQLAQIKQQEVHLRAEELKHQTVTKMADQQLDANQTAQQMQQDDSHHNDDVQLQQQKLQAQMQMAQMQQQNNSSSGDDNG